MLALLGEEIYLQDLLKLRFLLESLLNQEFGIAPKGPPSLH